MLKLCNSPDMEKVQQVTPLQAEAKQSRLFLFPSSFPFGHLSWLEVRPAHSGIVLALLLVSVLTLQGSGSARLGSGWGLFLVPGVF